MAVLFNVEFKPDEVRREEGKWVYRYGKLEGVDEDLLMARQALVRQVHSDPQRIITNMRRIFGYRPESLGKNGEVLGIPLLLTHADLPMGPANGPFAFIRIDFGIVQKGNTWICAGIGEIYTEAQDPDKAKETLVEKVCKEAQAWIERRGLDTFLANPARVGVTQARRIGPDEKEIKGFMPIFAAVKN